VSGYEGIFFDIDDWLPNVKTATALRDSLSPTTRLDMDEVGVILPDDNSDAWTGDAPGFPLSYWNACAASFLYRFILYAPLGLDYMGDSALAQIPNMRSSRGDRWAPQYPSVSILDWNSGAPTARYRLLELLIQSTNRGMAFFNATVTPEFSNPFCGSGVNLGGKRPARVDLACAPGAGVIAEVLFAAYGVLDPLQGCPTSLPLNSCAANATQLVGAACRGKSNCSLTWDDSSPLGDPCLNSVKTFTVTAVCSGEGGGAQVGPESHIPVVAQGVSTAGGIRRVLLLNKSARWQNVSVEGSSGGRWDYVDETTGGGPAGSILVPQNLVLTLGPFAAGVLTLLGA